MPRRQQTIYRVKIAKIIKKIRFEAFDTLFKTFDWPISQYIPCGQATFGAANKYRFENLRCEILVNHKFGRARISGI